MKPKDREVLRYAIDELFIALDNWMALRKQLEREAMEKALFWSSNNWQEVFNNADELCWKALYNVLSIVGWEPRKWREDREQWFSAMAERMRSDTTSMDSLRALVRLADSTEDMDAG